MIVLDASVAVAWFLPEQYASFAAGLVAARHELTAPDIIVAEVGSALAKAFRRGYIKQPRIVAAIHHLSSGIVELQPSVPLLPDAADLACRLRCSVYDAAYLELARRRRIPIVTDDARLAEVAGSINVRVHRPDDGMLPV